MWHVIPVIIFNGFYFTENIRIFNYVEQGQQHSLYHPVEVMLPTPQRRQDVLWKRKDVHQEAWEGVHEGLFIRREDAQTGRPRIRPLSDCSAPRTILLAETALHFALLYLTFPGISVHFLALSLSLNSSINLQGSKCKFLSLSPLTAKNAREAAGSSLGALSHSMTVSSGLGDLLLLLTQSPHLLPYNGWTRLPQVSFRNGVDLWPQRSRCFSNNTKYPILLAYWALLNKGTQAQARRYFCYSYQMNQA